jgi:muramoyltetrapeptide carboxypeptidase LdcA involved in peptidoglycan recycling
MPSAIFTTKGGKCAYRIAHALDFAAALRDPKPLIGYSDITILHLALWRQCRTKQDSKVGSGNHAIRHRGS